MQYKLTIDVDLMRVTPSLPAMDTLLRWKEEGKIELVEADPPRSAVAAPAAYGWPGAPPKPIERKTEWGGPKGRPKKMAESGKANFKAIAAVLFPGKDPLKLSMSNINQVAHLIKHHSTNNEIFVTSNKPDFIEGGRREVLKNGFGIIAMTPEETVLMISEMQGWEHESLEVKGARRKKR